MLLLLLLLLLFSCMGRCILLEQQQKYIHNAIEIHIDDIAVRVHITRRAIISFSVKPCVMREK